MYHLILFGPPGSGKGTQAIKLAEEFGLVQVSTGDLFRYEIGNNTPLGIKAKSFMDRGVLVPDEVTVGMLKNKVLANEGAAGFIFDGFPRTIAQAEALDSFLASRGLAVDQLIELKVDEDEIVQRIRLRGETSGRSDDKDEAIIRNRIAVYRSETEPVAAYYKAQNKAFTVNGTGTIDEIFGRLSELVRQAMTVW